MSQAKLRIWLTGALTDRLPAEYVREVCEKFLLLAANECGGDSVYIPKRAKRDTSSDERAANMRRCRDEGKSLRQIAEMFDCSHESVRDACQPSRAI